MFGKVSLNKPLKNRYTNSKSDYNLKLRSKRVEQTKLSAEEILSHLAQLDYWKVVDNKLLKRFKFANFAESLAFVNQVGEIAETHDHHPDITFGWGYADIFITTHDAGGITVRDIAVAKEIDQIEAKM